ncbi:hypothetical protein [Janthinobacterium sp. HLX7-2]|uniref:hypothetical protein n=1 Tax=Janthinobacterium sp. HLX7-2 TaxID=1259331 RepID=UPI003F2384D1
MLSVPLDLLAAVSLLRSDRWLVHCIESIKNDSYATDKALLVRTAAICDYTHYDQRREDIEYALALHWVSNEGGLYKLDFLRVLAQEWLVGKADRFEVPNEKLADYAGLMSLIDPSLLAATLMANDLHTGKKQWGDVETWSKSQCPHALPFDAHTPYADSHVHMAGVSAANIGLSYLALLSDKPQAIREDANWPLIQEFTQMRAHRIGIPQLCAILPFLVNQWLRQVFGSRNDDPEQLEMMNSLFMAHNTQTEQKRSVPWETLFIRCKGFLTYIKDTSPTEPVQCIIRRAIEMKGEHIANDAGSTWLMFLTALILDEQTSNPACPTGPLRAALRLAIIHAIHCLRSYAVMRGIGLTEFITFNSSYIRKVRGSGTVKPIHPALIRPNRFISLKAGPQFVDEKKLNKLVEDLEKTGDIDRFQFVYHFSRGEDPTSKKFKTQGDAFTSLFRQARSRAVELTGSSPIRHAGRLLRGLDVAGNENTGPIELFAPMLRKIRNDCRKSATPSSNVPALYLSIHAGEDFSHLLTGLRRIDETVRFCAMEKGDRLGHALALGIAPYSFAQRQRVAFVPLDEHLDNLVWLHHHLLIIKTHPSVILVRDFTPCIANLESSIGIYSDHLYGGAHCAADLFAAWTLRKYERLEDLDTTETIELSTTRVQKDIWLAYKDLYRPNRTDTTRRRPESFTAVLRLMPHDPGFGRVGEMRNGKVEEIVGSMQLDAIEAVQDYLMTKYAKADCDIHIEACPSSNLYIGRLEAFHEHPLYRWVPPASVTLQNRFGLREGSMKVCIGSDDPGIFPTTIENEHRILEDAAIRFHKANVDIARTWIDEIRNVGITQFERHA